MLLENKLEFHRLMFFILYKDHNSILKYLLFKKPYEN